MGDRGGTVSWTVHQNGYLMEHAGLHPNQQIELKGRRELRPCLSNMAPPQGFFPSCVPPLKDIILL